MDEITKVDTFENMMRAFDAGAALLCLLSEQSGRVIDDGDATLMGCVYFDMMNAKDAFEKAQTE